MRLIDADAIAIQLRQRSQTLKGTYGDLGGACAGVARLIGEAPTVDAVPVRRGKWRYKTVDSGYHTDKICPVCESQFAIGWNFCPNCGTDMREEDKTDGNNT